MRRAVSVSSLAFVFLAGSAAAQAKPDFSGSWTSEPEATSPDRAAGAARGGGGAGGGAGATGDMGSGWGSTITIAQTADSLVVEYMFFTRGDMQPPLRFAYALDGSETANTVMMGRGMQVQRSKSAWDGERLVITTLHAFPGPEDGRPMTSEVKQILSLESPSSLVIAATRSGVLGGPPSATRTLYGRRPEGM
ncbi:MAG: hypothetical protein WEF86_16190 [Gemmatimonadota bacterium]